MSSDLPSVLVSVRPPLLGSLLARLIESDTVRVVQAVSGDGAPYTIAVTTDPLPRGVRAGTVVRLPDPDRQGHAGFVHREDGDVIVPLLTPDDVVTLVRHLLAS